MTHLAHLTITSGHLSYIDRQELTEGELVKARDLLERALSGKPALMAPPWDRYLLHVDPFGAALHLAIGALSADQSSVATIVRFGVAPRSRSGRALWDYLMQCPSAAVAPPRLRTPAAPWIAVVLEPDLAKHQEIIPILGDLEAALAWAWLERSA